MRILHVVEALGGGVSTAVESYLRGTPECEHMLLARRRQGHDTGDSLDGLASSVHDLPPGHLRAVAAVKRVVERTRPDVVHAHSSFAGVYARLVRMSPRTAVVYTPHCYAFERGDVGSFARAAYLNAELLLARRAHVVAAVSPREADLARRLARHRAVVVVPNTAGFVSPSTVHAHSRLATIAGAGRICAQKDVDFFLEVVRAARPLAPDLQWRWIGGGAAADEDRLRSEGIDVTGWLPREAVLDALANVTAYVHTAAWEGSPLTLLEAAALGLPVVVRRTRSLDWLPRDIPSHASAEGLAGRAVSLRDPQRWAEARLAALALAEALSPEVQREALLDAYALALTGSVPGMARRA